MVQARMGNWFLSASKIFEHEAVVSELRRRDLLFAQNYLGQLRDAGIKAKKEALE